MRSERQAEIKSFIRVNADGCWIWQKTLTHDGYGKLGKSDMAYRVAYEAWKGPIPNGLVIDHLCRVPSCVNPHHLEPVTNEVNILRGYSPPAINARKTQCVNGHPFSPGNTYHWTRKSGRISRVCRACNAAAAARYANQKRSKSSKGDAK